MLFQEFRKYAVMVEQAVQLDAEMSQNNQSWQPDVFHRKMSLHTENVRYLNLILFVHQILFED